ncbi:sensory box histidine kinase/response regulator [Legionella gratiana]|uniref:histidine kinase n=1 Tax=Legionella gratiana TaxID=45066 RepID=A0A378JHP3_9GAMM|nr:PAS domain-containing sensor histidine kinase [Legionella gratiana]KTD11897.1 sensory box histidine kinase/response regulator [Legionella gratiana]STX46511.1 sensory box histidine kinase/response regulator [Legionella gratiana]
MKFSKKEISSFGKLYDLSKTALIAVNEKLVIKYLNSCARKLLYITKNISVIDKPLFHTLLHANLAHIINRNGTIRCVWNDTDNGVLQKWEKISVSVEKEQWYLYLCHSIANEDKNKLVSVQSQNTSYLNSIIENLPQLVYWKDRNGVYQGGNKYAAQSLNLNNTSEIKGKTDDDFGWSEERIKSLRDIDNLIIQTGVSCVVEDAIPINGLVKIYLTSKTPLRNEHGEIMGVLGISTDISEQKKLEEDLRKATIAAEAANTAKTEFIANMSHDIRTPLTGVIGLSEILEQTLQSPEEKEKAHLLHDSGEELLHMLNQVLDDVRAERLDEQDIHEESFDLYQCIEELIRLETPATALKHLQLKSDIASNVPRYIISDRNKIHRILLNLLGNAIKFTQSGQITLGIECLHRSDTHAHLKFNVSDTGIGIPEEIQEHIFNRFFKVSSSYKGLYDGHGLGLHIAQSYIALLGGHITVTSKEGIGSTFHFDLKCALGQQKDNVKTDLHTPLLFTQSPQRTIHILIVEDNQIALKTIEMFLSQKGYTFTSVTNAEEARVVYQKQPFDLMITDIGLPGLSGVELTTLIRKQELDTGASPLPIIGLTGHIHESAYKECLHAGMNEILSKPPPIEVLHTLIQQLTLPPVAQSIEILNNTSSFNFGIGLPNSEEELFQLKHFATFDETFALQQTKDKTLLVTLLQTYLSQEMQHDIVLLQQAYAQKDWKKIDDLVHKIKGGVTYLGAQRMRYACQYLECYYKAGHRDLLDKLYYQLMHVNEQTNNELRLWLENNSDSY